MNQVFSLSTAVFCAFLTFQVGFLEMPGAAQDSDRHKVVGEEHFRKQPNSDFHLGERFEYRAHYGFLNAGKGSVELADNKVVKKNRDCYKVAINGRTTGVFALGVKVEDKWVSYIDESAIMPHEFYRDISENKYRLTETSYFNQERGKVLVDSKKNGKDRKRETYEIPTYTQDMVSGYYYLRTLTYEDMEAGDIITMDAFFEDKLYDFQVRFEGRSVVKTKFGKVNAFKLKPVMPENKLFKGEDAITIWVSDDINRVPLKIDVNMFIGIFEIEIVDYEGLREELNWAE